MDTYMRVFASVYDQLQYDVDYAFWIEKISERLEAAFGKNASVLELACGTGTLAIGLSGRGFYLEGVDLSEDMLAQAQQKAFQMRRRIRFYQQDMRFLETHRTYDAVVSVCDGMNYMVEDADLKKTAAAVYKHLKPAGTFIFEMSTAYKFEKVIGNATFAETFEEVAYIWENHFDSEQKILNFDLTVFAEDETGHYMRYEEIHVQRAYAPAEIEKLLKGLFKIEAVLDSETFGPLTDTSERLCVIAVKI